MAKYRLGDIAPIKQGMVPEQNKYWLLNLDVVESNTGKVLEYHYVDKGEIGASTVSFDKSNVLYSKLRPYLNKVVLPEEAGYATSEMIPLRPNTDYITREYLTYYLRSPRFVGYINEKTSGAKMPRANTSDLKAVEIDCPSLNEQQRITISFNKLRTVIEMRLRELSMLDNLIKARFVEMFGDPMVNPKGYGTRPYGDLFELNAGGTPSKTKPEYWENGTISWIGSNLCQNTILYENDEKYISQEGYDHSSARLFPVDTVLIALVGATIGKTALLKFETSTNQNVLGVRHIAESGYNPMFVFYYTQFLYQKFMNIGDGGFNMASKGFVSELPMYDIDLSVQNDFAIFAEQIDKSKSAVKKALDEAQLLFDSLMQKYFG